MVCRLPIAFQLLRKNNKIKIILLVEMDWLVNAIDGIEPEMDGDLDSHN